MRTFDCVRAFGALESLAKAEVTLEETVNYAKQRVQLNLRCNSRPFRLGEAVTHIGGNGSVIVSCG